LHDLASCQTVRNAKPRKEDTQIEQKIQSNTTGCSRRKGTMFKAPQFCNRTSQGHVWFSAKCSESKCLHNKG